MLVTMIRIALLSVIFVLSQVKTFKEGHNYGLLVLTVTVEPNDGLSRLVRSGKFFNIPVEILRLSDTNKSDENSLDLNASGRSKMSLLRTEVQKYKDDTNLVVMYVDSSASILLNTTDDILSKFDSFDSKIVFAGDSVCWPDDTLAERYLPVGLNEKPYINADGFIGFASQIYKLLTLPEAGYEVADDYQLFVNQIYVNPALRRDLGLAIDTRSAIFQNLHDSFDEVNVLYRSESGYIYNVKTGTIPSVLHSGGNALAKIRLNSMSSYLVKSWNPISGCQQCHEDNLDLTKLKETSYPIIMVALILDYHTPFIEEFFERIGALSYPKRRIDMTIYTASDFHTKDIENFVSKFGSHYKTISVLTPKEYEKSSALKNSIMKECQKRTKSCDFVFFVDSIVQLSNPNTLNSLVTRNRSIIAPLMVRPGKLWSNFWGALNKDGFYARADDYVNIVERNIIGIWNVPYVTHAILIQSRVLNSLQDAFGSLDSSDSDLNFASEARHKNIFMLVDNTEKFGHLLNPEGFTTTHLHNDLWEIFTNPTDWEKKYINEDYHKTVDFETDLVDIEQPCPDVFWVPLMSPKFCRDMIEEMEHYGQWSDGSNNDSRLEGGYENVPTRDIHMRQVDWEKHWLHILKTYVYPIQKKIFAGFDEKPIARMNFVVRYRPDEQPILKPHHDSSSYSVNLALNLPNVDYEGGGSRFIRYNCSIIDSRLGWALLHPGRVTHLHEGLATTNGTRYIFVTFVNP